MSGRIIELEDVKNSKFNQKKNIKTISLNGQNSLFKLKIKTNSGTEVSAIDLTGTLTRKALHGNISISSSIKSKGMILLRSNEFKLQNGNESDQNLLDYVASVLSIPTEEVKNIRPFTANIEVIAFQPIPQNEQVRLPPTNQVQNIHHPPMRQPVQNSIPQKHLVKFSPLNFERRNELRQSAFNEPEANAIPNSRSRPFQMPISADTNSVQSFHSLNPSNPFVPNKSNPDQPSSFKQQYNKPINTYKRPLVSIIDDVRLELRKKPKIEILNMSPTKSPLPSSDDISTENEASDILNGSESIDLSVIEFVDNPIEEILSIQESIKFDDDNVADFQKASQQHAVNSMEPLKQPIEELDEFDLFFQADVAAENEKLNKEIDKVISSKVPTANEDSDSDVVLIEEKIHTPVEARNIKMTKGMDLSSDVILIENSIYNTSFQDA